MRRERVVMGEPVGVKDVSGGGEPSIESVVALKDGRGTRCVARKSEAGVRPADEGTIQIVPPVMTIKTRDSEGKEETEELGSSVVNVGGCAGV